jgi:translation initiation factor 2 subunit 2
MTKEKLDTKNYEALLNRAKDRIPEELSVTERLEIAKVKGHVQGNKTIITNFFQICKTLDREPEHILKFLSKELATKADVKNTSVLFINKLSSSKINEKIQKYADIFVICKECGKPETKLVKENNITFLRCQACGAKYTIQYRL